MLTFGRPVSTVRSASDRIALSERGFEGGKAVEHQCYPGMSEPEDWREMVDRERHAERANYLFADGHVESLKWRETIGDGSEKENRHFFREWLDHYEEAHEHNH